MSDLAEYLAQNDPSFRRARLPALYSDFRGQQSLNPDGYVANVTAWRSGLARLAWDGRLSAPSAPSPRRLVVDTDDSLPAKLQSRQFGRPLALGAVVRDAAASKDLVPLADFLARKESIYTKEGWSLGSVPWAVASWAARQVGLGGAGGGGGGGAEDKVPKGSYVVVANVERAADAVAEKIGDANTASRFDRTFTRAHFEREFTTGLPATAAPPLSGPDTDVLVRFLQRDRNLVVSDGRILRLKTPSDPTEEDTITQEDVTVAELRVLVGDLAHQNNLLAKRVEDLAVQAKEAVGRRNNAAAMALLRQKKTAESMLSRRAAALHQMEDLAGRIQQARDQVQLVRVLEGSAGVLKQLNAEVGGAERVEGVMDVLREQMTETEELGRILASAGEDAIDEAEVDAELAEMERAEAERREAEAREEREEKEKKEAEATRQRLEEAGAPPADGRTTPATEAAEQLTRMALEELPKPLPAN
ncbi:SNF7 family protein [Plectosphaerella cucumerina]|uniref:SNF7 family protein n=1 Tax=Plectosphaerella cucumerina TaxID=40658 RepID=A0A8K0X9N9_9PEZI|nr:SNF7 family protein [Plectosphaerella cucumerina]